MPYDNVRSISMTPTTAAITAGRFVALANGGEVAQSGDGADALGVALEASAASSVNAIPVSLLDGSKQEVEAGAAIDVSAAVVPIASNASGQAITAATGDAILGYALSSAGAAGETISFVASKASRQA